MLYEAAVKRGVFFESRRKEREVNGMWGAIFGDIVGSRFEWDNHRDKNFELFEEDCSFTDDSVMTIAVAKSLAECGEQGGAALREAVIRNMQQMGRKYWDAGYGGMFARWLESDEPEPYNSFGNGAAMRISPVGDFARSEEEVKRLSRIVTEVTHNHPEGIKGAECVAMCIFLAKQGHSKEQIFERVKKDYYPQIGSYTCAELSKTNLFDETCQGSVPQALTCFFEGKDFEDTIRNAISIGGDSDTIAAIAGGIAEAFFGMEERFMEAIKSFLSRDLQNTVASIEKKVYRKA